MVPALRFTRNALQKVQTAAQRLDAVGIVGTSRYCCRTQLQSSCNGQECAQGILLGKKPKQDGERRVLQERQRLDELPLDLNLKVQLVQTAGTSVDQSSHELYRAQRARFTSSLPFEHLTQSSHETPAAPLPHSSFLSAPDHLPSDP